MPRYTDYWNPIIIKIIQAYNQEKTNDTPEAQRCAEAVEQAIKDTEELPDGSLRIRAVRMVYINKSHTTEGAAMRLYVSTRTVSRYLKDFVDLVADKKGFKVGER